VPTNGIYSPGADQLAISTGGTGRLFVDGTSSISRVTAFNSTEALLIGSDTSSNQRMSVGWQSVPSGWTAGHKIVGDGVNLYYYTRLGQNGSHIFSTNNAGATAERLRITSDGKLGLGTSSPSYSFDLLGGFSTARVKRSGGANDMNLQLESGAGQIYKVTVNDSGEFNLQKTSTSRLFIDSSGRVGIGTTSPDSKISIGGSGANRISFSGSTGQQYVGFDASEDVLQIASNTAIKFQAGSSYAERARITSDGKLGVGTSSPDALLTVSSSNSDSVSNTRLRFVDSDTTAVANQYLGRIEFYGSDASGPGAGVKSAITARAQTANGDSYLNFSTSSPSGNDQVAMTIDSSQRVGIGTTTVNANARLHTVGGNILVQGDGGANTASLILAPGSTPEDGASIAISYTGSGSYGPLVFGNGGLERARITSDGKLGLGISSPAGALHVDAASGVDGPIFDSGGTANSNHALLVRDSANNQLLRVNNDGKVGLGTTSPGYRFELRDDNEGTLAVGGKGLFNTSYTTVQGIFKDGNSSVAAIGFNALSAGGANTPSRINTNFSAWSLNTNTSNATFEGQSYFRLNYINTSGIVSSRIAVDPSGNVGIGTTSPNTKLEIRQDSAGSIVSLLKLNNNATIASGKGVKIEFGLSDAPAAGARGYIENVVDGSNGTYMAFGVNDGATGTFEAVRIDRNRRLLVGTSSNRNGCLQQIEGTTGASAFSLIRNSDDTSGPELIIGKTRATSVGGVATVVSGDSLGSLIWVGADGTDANTIGARIQAVADGGVSGNDLPTRLVFSTTADGAASPTERMRISNGGILYTFVSGNAGNYFATNQAAGTTATLLRGAHSATANALDGTECFKVFSNGNVVNTNNSYLGISDIKLKENIVDANSQWNDLKALQVRNYNLKEGQTHTQIGLVAQEVELVSPGLVSESPDRDEEGNDLGTVTKSVNYSVLYMKAVKALQEAMERIETLEAKVAALEAS
jgi:hypothetical protein